MAEMSDAELLEQARAGSREALEALLERYQSHVYRFGMRMCRDTEDAKDVLQETLLSVARGVRDFRGASSVSTWLYTIARSFCIKKRRKSKFAPSEVGSLSREDAPLGVESSERGPEEALLAKQLELALEQAIVGLEPAAREVLLLRDAEGLTAPEVAQVLGVSVDAVKSRLHRARLLVRERVAPLLGVPDAVRAAADGCPDVLTLFSRHLEDEISAEVCAEMERHLSSCTRCRARCDSLKRTLLLCRTAPAAAVPAAIQDSVRVALREWLATAPAPKR